MKQTVGLYLVFPMWFFLFSFQLNVDSTTLVTLFYQDHLSFYIIQFLAAFCRLFLCFFVVSWNSLLAENTMLFLFFLLTYPFFISIFVCPDCWGEMPGHLASWMANKSISEGWTSETTPAVSIHCESTFCFMGGTFQWCPHMEQGTKQLSSSSFTRTPILPWEQGPHCTTSSPQPIC